MILINDHVKIFEGVTAILKNGQNWKFLKYLGIWGIPPNTWKSGEFPKYLRT